MKIELSKRFKKLLSILTVWTLFTFLPFYGFAAAAPLCSLVHQTFSATATSAQTKFAHKVDFLLKTYPKGSLDFYSAWKFSSQILKLSYEEQQEWVRAIGKAYRQIPKKDPDPMAKRHIGGRRLLDFILNRIQNNRDRFQSRIEQDGLSPRQAYQEYLAHQADIFGSSYSASEVELVISFIQSQLKALEKIYIGAPLKVSLGGSFPNGKADLMVSDIDLSLSNAGAYKWMQNWQAKLNQTFQNAGIASKMEIGFSTEPALFYGGINPVVIEISSSKVQLVIFPAGQIQVGGETVRPSGEPLIYEWQSN